MKIEVEILGIVATSCSDLTKCTEARAAARWVEEPPWAAERATLMKMTMAGGDVWLRVASVVDKSVALIRRHLSFGSPLSTLSVASYMMRCALTCTTSPALDRTMRTTFTRSTLNSFRTNFSCNEHRFRFIFTVFFVSNFVNDEFFSTAAARTSSARSS